jgi:hypothetical protein
MELTKGSVSVVKKFIDSNSTRAAGMTEMQEFWKSCTDEEKLQYTQEALILMPELSPSLK